MSDVSVIIAGSRGLQVQHSRITAELEKLVRSHWTEPTRCWQIVSGGEPSGADKCGEIYAKVNNLAVRVFPANWNQHGRGAGPIRNKEMAVYADAAIVFMREPTPGSSNMVAWMLLLGKPVHVVRVT